MQAELYIQNGQTVYAPTLTGGVSWETQRKGAPGKLSFTLCSDPVLKIEEGNAVRLDVDGKPVFFGFLFERSWNADGQIKVTAYDQLRYLKNKDTYNYENLTAAGLIARIAGDFHLRAGELEDTGYVIAYRSSRDKTLFDTILDALDLTMTATGRLFVLYDDVGKLTLKSLENMKLPVVLQEDTAQNYDFKTSIDSNTYNQIKMYADNNETKLRDIYIAKHTENINKWGVLQYNESVVNGASGQAAAETYLTLYNSPARSLSVKGAFGDIRVRAGCLIPVFLDIREMQLKNYLLVESVTHTFEGGVHTMDLTLKGAGINA